jgi:hypothetical protein
VKLSLADLILQAIERSDIPVETTILTRMAYVKGYKHPREQVWWNLEQLKKNGYVRPHKVGKGGKPSSWVPTVRV